MARRPLSEIGLYAVSMFLISASGFATAPLLLSQLGIEGFALWARIEPLVLTAVPLAGLGLNIGYLHAHGTAAGMGGKLLPYHAAFAACTGLAAALLTGALTQNVLLFLLTGAIVFCEGTLLFFAAFWRASRQPGRFAVFEGGRAAITALILAACLWAVSGFPASAAGYLGLRGGIAALALAAGYGVLRWPLKPDRAAAKRAARFGLPVVLASACAAVILHFDRYGVALTGDAARLAAYAAHVKLAQVLGSALAPFFVWLAPAAIARIRTGDMRDGFFERSFLAFCTVNLALSLGLWLITPLVWPLLFPVLPFDPQLFLLLLAGASVFACGNPLSIGTLTEGRTARALALTSVSAGAGVLAIALLAPSCGMMGVAAGKFLAMLCYTVLFARDTRKSLGIRYDWSAVALMAAVCAALAGLAGVPALSPPQHWIAALFLPVLFLAVSVPLIARRGL